MKNRGTSSVEQFPLSTDLWKYGPPFVRETRKRSFPAFFLRVMLCYAVATKDYATSKLIESRTIKTREERRRARADFLQINECLHPIQRETRGSSHEDFPSGRGAGLIELLPEGGSRRGARSFSQERNSSAWLSKFPVLKLFPENRSLSSFNFHL